jgi:hypothetical protein
VVVHVLKVRHKRDGYFYVIAYQVKADDVVAVCLPILGGYFRVLPVHDLYVGEEDFKAQG